MLIIVLAFFGLACGSFVNALVWRIHEQGPKSSKELSVMHGRSMCPHCRHELAAKDLIPLASWLILGGRCRYCKKPISAQYPIVELATALVFVTTYIFWPSDLAQNGEKLLLLTTLLSSTGLMALLVYDLKWMLLPNRIIYPTLLVALVGRLAYIGFYSNNMALDFVLLIGTLLVTSGLFWLIFEVSKGQWIGFGDVRLGLILGCLLAKPSLGMLMIFIASVLGIAGFVAGSFGKHRSLSQKIPFGPFLIASSWLTVLFGQKLIDWYLSLLS